MVALMAATAPRLLRLLSLFQTRRDWPGRTLAEQLAVSPRTVRRDVDRLRGMGYRITAVMGPDGGYRLDAGARVPPLLFDDDQVVALTVALQAAALSGAGIDEAAQRALASVRHVLPPRLTHRIDTVQFTVLPPGRGSVDPDVLGAVSAAVRDRRQLRFDYAGGGSDREDLPHDGRPRQVEPHHLVVARGRWYLVGWDLDREDWRLFRVDRLAPRTPTGPRFTPRTVPGGDAHSYVRARFKGSDRSDAWPCRGTVILGLPASEVVPFAGDGTVAALDDRRCSIETGSWSWPALAALIGRFDTDIEVVAPDELRIAFGVLAERFAATSARPLGGAMAGTPPGGHLPDAAAAPDGDHATGFHPAEVGAGPARGDGVRGEDRPLVAHALRDREHADVRVRDRRPRPGTRDR